MLNLTVADAISRAIVFLVAVTIHEFAHAYVAYQMGDSTAKEQGRMTLDPRANVYWPGFLIGIMIGFAILGSAPVNPRRMRNPRWGMVAAVMAGPVSNLVVAAIFAFPFQLGLISPFGSMGNEILPSFLRILQDMIFLNVLLFIFNLLPIPPLDGFHIAVRVLPHEIAAPLARLQPYGMMLLLLLFFAGSFGFNILGLLVSTPSIIITRLLIGI